MIRLRDIFRRNTWLLIAVIGLSPMGLHAQSGAVLCIEADGHFSIEPSVGSGCASDTLGGVVADPESEHQVEHVSGDASHCDDCVDVVITAGVDEDCQAISVTVTNEPSSRLGSVIILAQDRNERSCLTVDPTVYKLAASNLLTILSTVIFLT